MNAEDGNIWKLVPKTFLIFCQKRLMFGQTVSSRRWDFIHLLLKDKGKKNLFSLSILPKNYKYCWSEANEHEKEEKRKQGKENFISFL